MKQPINCKCYKCGHEWQYKGKREESYAYITCPYCRTPKKIEYLTQNYDNKKEKEELHKSSESPLGDEGMTK